MMFIRSGRAELATEVIGSGEPVIFLHANVCDTRMWRHELAHFGAARKAISYDRRGFGQTRVAPEDFSAHRDLMAVLDATAGDRPAILVGCSLGGRLALDVALRQPARVKALVLIAPSLAGVPDPVHPAELQPLMARVKEIEASGDLDRINAMKAHLWLDGPLAPEGRVTGAARDLFLDMNGIALRSPPYGPDIDILPFFPRLAEIAAPTLVIWGDLDFPYIQERCRHLTAVMPRAEGHEMQGVAHLPNLEHPAEITALIEGFLGGLEK